jgi:hypothetical protein
MKKIIMLIICLSLLTACQPLSEKESKNLTPEQTLEKYHSYSNFDGLDQALENDKAKMELTTSPYSESFKLDIALLNSKINMKNEFNSTCQEAKELFKTDICKEYGIDVSSLDKYKREFKILSSETIKNESNIVEIKINLENIFNGNKTVSESIYIFKKEEGIWKLSDIRDEKGVLSSSQIEEEEKEVEEVIKTNNEIISNIRKALDKSKEEINDIIKKGYPMNKDIKVDYLTYKITKAETFTEMGTSLFKKETNGKFIKVYLDITNNAKETKQIFSPRFQIIDNYERKYDRVADDMMYIADYLQLGVQLQPGLTKSGAIVFELPKDSDNLKLIISGDWISVSEVIISLDNINNIGKDTTLKDQQDKMMDEARAESQTQMDELTKEYGLN